MDNGFLLAWIEDAFGAGKDGKADSAESTAEKGLRVASPRRSGSDDWCPAAHPRGERLCRDFCHARLRSEDLPRVLTTAQGESLTLGAFELTPGSPAGPLKTIAVLTGPVTQDVSPVFSSGGAGSLFFADDAVGGSGRVRWMQIGWP